MSKVSKFSVEDLKKLLSSSLTKQDFMYSLGYSTVSGKTWKVVEDYLTSKGISTDWDDVKYIRKRKPLDSILVDGSNYSSSTLKKRLILELGWEDICSECGIGNMWHGKPLTLQLDHINGKHTDNRLENLRILCPNCHTQTDTYGTKNKTNNVKLHKVVCKNCSKEFNRSVNMDIFCSKFCEDSYYNIKLNSIQTNEIILSLIDLKYSSILEIANNFKIPKERFINYLKTIGLSYKLSDYRVKNYSTYNKDNKPTKEELEKLLFKYSFSKVGELYGVSDNAIRKWCKKLGLSSTAKDYDTPEKQQRLKDFGRKNIQKLNDKKKRHVGKFDRTTLELLEEFDSVADAKKLYGGNVDKVLYSGRPSAYGYVWKFI